MAATWFAGAPLQSGESLHAGGADWKRNSPRAALASNVASTRGLLRRVFGATRSAAGATRSAAKRQAGFAADRVA